MLKTTSRTNAQRLRIERDQRRMDTRNRAVKRRERTRQLIELGGLVQKAGLIDLADDDRAVLYGAFLQMAAVIRGETGESAKVLWRRRGQRAFEAELAQGRK